MKDGQFQVEVSCGKCRARYTQALYPGERVSCCGACGYCGEPVRSSMVTKARPFLTVREVQP